MTARRLDGADRVGKYTAVIVMFGIENPFGHAAREMGIPAIGIKIRGITRRPTTSLAARVHDEVSVTRAGPKQPLDCETASATIADIFHNTRKFSNALRLGGQNQPAFDRLSTEAVEGHVEGILRDETIIHFFKGRVQRKRSRFLQGGFPERVKICGFVAVGAVGLEFAEREVKECHGILLCKQVDK